MQMLALRTSSSFQYVPKSAFFGNFNQSQWAYRKVYLHRVCTVWSIGQHDCSHW